MEETELESAIDTTRYPECERVFEVVDCRHVSSGIVTDYYCVHCDQFYRRESWK